MADANAVQTTQLAQVNTQLTSATNFLGNLASLINIQQPDIGQLPDPDYSAATANLYNLLQITPPFFSGSQIIVQIPDAPAISFGPIESITVPDFNAAAPAVVIPTAPDVVIPAVPAQPTITDIALPTAPTISLPALPTLGAINIPLPPSISIPAFTATLPLDDLVTPTNTFQWAEQPYQSALLDAEKAKLLNDLVNGGYGIEPLDETNLWNRARDREVDTTNMEIEEIYRSASARGFPLPPQDLTVAIQRSLQNQQDKLSDISRDIAIKRADMFVENRKFTITEVRQLETMLINFHNSIQERALNAQKATLDAAISIFRVQLERYNARIDAYRTQAQVFESQLRAVATQVEIYRTQIEAARVTADVQRLQVETYSAQLRGIALIVDIYKTQMDAANIASQVQRTKIEAFRSLIDAYTAQVQAQVAVQNAFEARIKGELAKVQVFEAEASAYKSQVEGLNVRSQIILGKARAEWEQANAKVGVYRGQLEGADIQLKTQLGAVDANVRSFAAQTGIYVAQTNALGEQLKLDEAAIQNSRQIQVAQANVQVSTAQLRLARAIETLKVQATGFSIAGSYWSSLLAALGASVQSIATVQD